MYVARHGETTWNVAGRYQGRRESELTALGLRQALALSDAMVDAHVGRVIASPLLRCVATATVSADRLNLTVERDDRLIEIAHGSWEGRLRDEIAANDPQRYCAWRHDPSHVAFEGGETIAHVLSRWRDFAASLSGAKDVPTLVVTHDAVVRVAIVDALDAGIAAFWKPRVENGAYATFGVTPAGWTLLTECSATHLGALRAPIDTQAL